MAETLTSLESKLPYRFERKFVAPTDEFLDLRNQILSLPGNFRLLHPARRVNNLYFDTTSLLDFISTINGEKSRHKVRLRWYGETYAGSVERPQLEVKIKSDQANTKKIAALDGGTPDNLPLWVKHIQTRETLPADVKEALALRKPKLINTYYRHYYGSADGLFRLTLDQNVAYQAINRVGLPTGQLLVDENRSVIEIKYDIASHTGANRISAGLPYRLSRNSKYCNGIIKLMEQGYL